jgi:hypothetical protein
MLTEEGPCRPKPDHLSRCLRWLPLATVTAHLYVDCSAQLHVDLKAKSTAGCRHTPGERADRKSDHDRLVLLTLTSN